jgi:hypothetical protein
VERATLHALGCLHLGAKITFSQARPGQWCIELPSSAPLGGVFITGWLPQQQGQMACVWTVML